MSKVNVLIFTLAVLLITIIIKIDITEYEPLLIEYFYAYVFLFSFIILCSVSLLVYNMIMTSIRQLDLLVVSSDLSKSDGIVFNSMFSALSDLSKSVNVLISRIKQRMDAIDSNNYIDRATLLPNKLWINDRCEHVNFGAMILFQVESVNDIANSLKFNEYELFMREISSVLNNIIGEDAVIIRIDSDKYALGVESEFKINYLIDKVKTINSYPFDTWSNTIYVDFWFGTSSSSIGYVSTATSLLDDAKLALYEARRTMVRHVHFNILMRQNNENKMRTYNKLKVAVSNDEFIPYFQPIVDFKTNRIVGAEALARWHEPNDGIIGPQDFIQLAEDTGLIDLIGISIIRKTLIWYKSNSGYLGDFNVHINISIKQLMNSSFPHDIESLLRDVDYNYKNIYFELTESIYMESKLVLENLEQIRKLGIKLSIDDFGTGYSSFSYLRDIEFNSLKIDRSFVNSRNIELLKAMVGMGKSLGCEVIAEGVETKEQCEILKKMNCDFVQGYFYSKPLPESEFVVFFESFGKIKELVKS
ncbi:GGDEF domain-containing protein [Vibrio ponticus]|uniref:GGDEF domain-containing protein n=2 Tax=Vibrio ponticus TaxID=265668 RepID=A0A3N3DPN2_9VIBR|nr:GGDEF domain-containing protein [Vibrio ponticus]